MRDNRYDAVPVVEQRKTNEMVALAEERRLRERLADAERALIGLDPNYTSHYWAKYRPVTPANR
jgi:hypothetical protein